MDFYSLLDLSFLSELLSPSGKAALTEKLLIVAIVWFVMGRKVSAHFKALEQNMINGFKALTKAIDDVKDALKEVESCHGKQLKDLNGRVDKIESKLPK